MERPPKAPQAHLTKPGNKMPVSVNKNFNAEFKRYKCIVCRKSVIFLYRARRWARKLRKYSEPYLQKFAKKPAFRWAIGCLILIMLLSLWRCMSQYTANKVRPAPPVPVVIASVLKSNVPITISALGTVTPTYNITIRTPINGQLMRVMFKEGQTVQRGELLAEIDSRPYEAQLLQFEGQLARDQALLENARMDLKRYQVLYKQDSIAEQTLTTQDSLVKQLEGAVKFDQGQIETVKVNLTYSKIISPVNGRVGLRLVDPGNYVQTSDTSGLFVINTLQPINVIFSIPEDSLPEVIEQVATGKQLIVEAYDRAQSKLLATGTLLTVDNQIDTTTGTVKVKAEFTNENNVLFPNQFVNIKLLVNTLQDALIVPSTAIQRGTHGSFVYVVNNISLDKSNKNENKDEGNKKNQTVRSKPVTIKATTQDNTAIVGDLLPGESVVVEGSDKLTDGASILPVQKNNNHSQNNAFNKDRAP